MAQKTRKKVFIVIAAFNEEKAIGRVIKGLQKNKYTNIVVVDDCSADRTAEVARRAGAIVLRHAANKGQGAALRTGMKYALSKGANYIVHFDADGQHRPDEVKDLLTPLFDGQAEVALGSRFLGKDPTGIPWFRRFALKTSVFILRVFYGLPVTDAHNGFRAMTARAARKIRITQDRMAHASEIIELIAKHKLSWIEVPVHIRYNKYSLRKGTSSIPVWIGILARMIWKRFSHFFAR
ncbi:glycosyltransferase family 2 protein [Candidatus Woesearchaeota archaeon]|nr:MAG: glycosyltransferase family 2 protein [Candidatus Woesearchaeota archaeon]